MWGGTDSDGNIVRHSTTFYTKNLELELPQVCSRVRGQNACGHEHTNASGGALASLAQYCPTINKALAKAARCAISEMREEHGVAAA